MKMKDITKAAPTSTSSKAKQQKLPPKISTSSCPGMGGGGVGGATTTAALNNDELLSTLLRFNNFDSISSIKDESLDIDLSACVTISAAPLDPAGALMNGNSLDFWRTLDDTAQAAQLDLSSTGSLGGDHDNLMSPAKCLTGLSNSSSPIMRKDELELSGVIKNEQGGLATAFGGMESNTFLRPNPPQASSGITGSSLTFTSPLKRSLKTQGKPEQGKPSTTTKPLKSSTPKSPSTASSSHSQGPNKKKEKCAIPICTIKAEPVDTADCIAEFEALYSEPSQENEAGAIMSSTSTSFSQLLASAPQKSPLVTHQDQQQLEQSTKESEEGQNVQIPLSSGGVGGDMDLLKPMQFYKCLDCHDLIFQDPEDLAKHREHRLAYKCPDCDKHFEQEAGMKKHAKTHRSLEARKDTWKKCPDCGKCLKMGSMWMHRKIHSDNKKYSCDVCGQKFVQKINLTHHVRVHTAEKPYECPECQKRFQERSHLQRHQKYHAQTRSYRCEKCGKMYKTERCLKVHNLVHLEQRPFACTVCEKSFISNSKLKQHSNIHTGERPFKCNYCPRDFTNFPNWLKHTRRRHKVDHKTGEQLENIPSYCSKKSTKTAKATKVATATATTPAGAAAKTGSDNVAASSEGGSSTTITTTTVGSTIITTITTTAGTGQGDKKSEAATPSATNTTAAVAAASGAIKKPDTSKTQPKRKKKLTTATSGNSESSKETGQGLLARSEPNTKTQGGSTVTSESKTPKAPKRERKQPMPKQVQKSNEPLKGSGQQPIIKKEKEDILPPVGASSSTTTTSTHFPDLHCLSITSAEELIMEQALEMEECGLLEARVGGTDNAISSEAAAELQFKIKHELGTAGPDSVSSQEEFIAMKECPNQNRILCSSLESSPFSSPASIELHHSPALAGLHSATTTTAATSVTAAATAINTNEPNITNLSNFYTFPFNQTTINALNPQHTTNRATTSSPPPLVMQQTTTADGTTVLQQISLANLNAVTMQHLSGNASTTLNHLYMPMTMTTMPLLIQSHQQQQTPQQQQQTTQVLPTVDTLLYANAGYLRGKSAASAAAAAASHHHTVQHNLS